MALREGDVVRIKPERIGGLFDVGDEFVVREYDEMHKHYGGPAIKVFGMDQWLRLVRFTVIKKAYKAGDTVKCVDALGSLVLVYDRKYTVEKVYEDGTFKLKDSGTRYHPRRFELVAVAGAPVAPDVPVLPGEFPFDPALWWPEAGEKVYIIGNGGGFTYQEQRQYINDGKAYALGYVYGNEQADVRHPGCTYTWSKDAMRPVWAGKKKQEIPGQLTFPDKPLPAYVPPKVGPQPKSAFRETVWDKVKETGGICAFGFKGTAGREDIHGGQPCHAALARSNVGEVAELVYSVRHDLKHVPEAARPAYQRYLDYILNRSPWAHAFLTKDAEEAMEQDVFMNVEVNRHVIAAACVAIRMAHEYLNRIRAFSWALDNGACEPAAWLFCCSFSVVMDASKPEGWGGGHDVIDGGRDMAETVKFFREGYTSETGTVKEPFRTSHGHYRISDPICRTARRGQDSIRTWTNANFNAVVTGEGWNKKSSITKESAQAGIKTLNKLITGKE